MRDGTRMLAGVGMAAALIFASIGAHAEAAFSAEDGNSLYAKCIEQSFYFYQGMCVGYIVGISDAMRGGVSIDGRSACIPISVTEGQLLDVTKQFLTSHAERRQLGAARLIAQALADAFPCH
jgi:Rap1a immunity proteins